MENKTNIVPDVGPDGAPRVGLLREHPDLVRLVIAYLSITDGNRQRMALDFVTTLAQIGRVGPAEDDQPPHRNSVQ